METTTERRSPVRRVGVKGMANRPNAQVTTRVNPTDTVKLELWGKSAGRCAMCSQSLFGHTPYYRSTLAGQIAHNIGATSGAKSPRGESPLDGDERAAASNLLLLCFRCHSEIDDGQKQGLFTTEVLTDLKQTHELRVAKATDFASLRPTALLVVDGTLRESEFDFGWKSVVPALLESGLTTALESGVLCHDHRSLNDDESREYSYQHGLDELVRAIKKIRYWLQTGEVQDVAVFALASIPLLVSLGAQLDDIDNVWVYQKQRDAKRPWDWKPEGTSQFTFAIANEHKEGHEVLAVISVSGSVDRSSISEDLLSMPMLLITSTVISPEAIVSQAELSRFRATWLAALGEVERKFPKCSRLHVIAAVPNSAAITLGQSRMRAVHPEFVVYQRKQNGTYEPAILIRDGAQEVYFQ